MSRPARLGRHTRWEPGRASVTFRLHDPIDHPEFAWPRTLLHWPVRWPEPALPARRLRLVDAVGTPVPFQLSEMRTDDEGRLHSAVVGFFAALAPGQSHEFTLCADESIPLASVAHPVTAVQDDDGIVVDAGAIRVRLPRSHRPGAGQEAPPTPGPILALDRGHGWVGRSALAGVRAQVERIDVREVQAGPLVVAYEIGYLFAGGGRYTATVRCVQGYDFVELTERMRDIDGPVPEWELRWDGFSPTHRFSSTWPYSQDATDHLDPGSPETYRWPGIDEPLLVADSGEDPAFSGPGRPEDPREEMAFTVGPYAPAYAWDIRPHATFWDVRTGDTTGVFVRDPGRWDDHRYASWASARDLQIRFRYRDGVLHWRWPLRTGTRRTGIAFYDHERDRDVLRSQQENAHALSARYDIDPEAARRAACYQSTHVRQLYHWHSTLDLDRVKDWELTYGGRRPAPLCATGEIRTGRELFTALFAGADGPRLIAHGVNEVAGYLNIGQRPLYDRLLDAYDRLRGALTPRQAARVDALLLLTGYVSAGEEIGPMRRMFGGHPNFMSDGKAALACLAWFYPEHPAAGDWLDQFETFLRLAGVYNTRPALPDRQARPGRWTESLATYVWAFLRPATLGNALGIRADGHNRLCTPQFAALGAWLVDALTAPVTTAAAPDTDVSATAPGALRMHPPQGAHASWPRRPPIEMRLLGEQLRRYRPLVAEHLLWGCDAAGHRLDQPRGAADPWRTLHPAPGDRGTNPRLGSSKYTGYGITLRAGVGEPTEVSVHLQQTDRGPNYRWGIANDNGSGHLYYYAAGRAYSGHGREDAGDRRAPDATFVSSCGIWRGGALRSLGPNTLDRPHYDLDTAQYAEITPARDSPVYGHYLGRSVILVGRDYLVVYDAVAATQRMVWTWVTLTRPTGGDANSSDHLTDRMPFIHVVRGVRTDGAGGGEFCTPVSQGVRLESPPDATTGSTLAIVSHRDDLTIDPQHRTTWGARITTADGVDYVFRHERAAHHEPEALDVTLDAAGLRFRGTAGVIRVRRDGERQLVLFHGTAIGTDDVLLTTDDPDLGISLCYRAGAHECHGSYRAPGDTTLTLRVPAGRRGAAFHVDGAPVRPLREAPEEVTVALPAGRHRWELTTHAPRPAPAGVRRTVSAGAAAEVHFTPVPAAEEYLVQLSEDGGDTWRTAATARTSPCRLTGLADGTKLHVRVVAANSRHQAPPGADYPLYVTDAPPAPPHGLAPRPVPGGVELSWGEVLGASGYRVLRRRRGEAGYREIFAGLAFSYIDRAAAPGDEYAVAAENGNGLGPPSAPVPADPGSWRHWHPPVPLTFRRTHTYHEPPYLPDGAAPQEYDAQRLPSDLPAITGP
ncbi:fibronectin type III domain-containing protein [Dactylosporangium salmoneum]|uniref:Fibronectin type-III domain-containing protein n=1 Tax=Dactylosporangium salmoneum TaxID=53361 RepID=A0ABN3G6I8_9ACTN